MKIMSGQDGFFFEFKRIQQMVRSVDDPNTQREYKPIGNWQLCSYHFYGKNRTSDTPQGNVDTEILRYFKYMIQNDVDSFLGLMDDF